MEYINETLLLFPATVRFRETYPELVQKWERQIATDHCGPDLYFCLSALDDYPRLRAFLDSREYLFDFAINAHILYDTFMSRFVLNGYDEGQAVELANREIRSVYRSLDDSTGIMEDPLGSLYFELFEFENGSVGQD
ncbi:hypothetical protein [Pricia antarctica]|nr:hypothetical protein [Pricia antarctica]